MVQNQNATGQNLSGSDRLGQDAVERWFIRQGLPHAIHDYAASTDVLTRAAPFLSLVFLLEATASFGDQFSGWSQALVFVLAVAVLLAGVALLNTYRKRPKFALPNTIGLAETALFVFGPPFLPLLFLGDGSGFLLLALFNIVLLGVTYMVVSFGMIPMFRSGARHIVREVGGLGRLMLKSLPLLLLFATFLFLNAEMWQVAHGFTPVFYTISVGFVAAIAFVFLALRIPAETASLAGFDTWEDVCHRAFTCGAPVETHKRKALHDPPKPDPLAWVDRLNIGVLLFMRQAVQVFLVAMVIGAFYILFGLFTVRKETILQWTELTEATFADRSIYEMVLFGTEVALTWELLAVSGFIAAFSALQFSVSLITDDTYREEFFNDAANDVRNVLAVRALYLNDIYAHESQSDERNADERNSDTEGDGSK